MAKIGKNSNRGSKPGERRGGRKKGTPNKTTVAMKECLQHVYDEIGGMANMAAWAKENPGDFYKLWIKMLPADLTLDVNATLTVVQKKYEYPDRSAK